ncbi:MAG: M50 family metallopeptidase [Vulcanimicrobiaceae bacterium]
MMLMLAMPALDGVAKIAVFLVMLSVLVVLHEGGHFLLARRNGVRVNDFAVGFGPTLLKWTSPRSGTNYRLNLLPIGGYCAMQGEDGKSNEAEQQRVFRAAGAEADNFQAKRPWQRLAIVLAGPAANLVLAFLILLGAALAFGVISAKPSTIVGFLEPGYPGVKAGLQFGDRILSIDGVPMRDGEQMVQVIHRSAGVPLLLRFERQGEVRSLRIAPKSVVVDGKPRGLIGFAPMPVYQHVGVVRAAGESWREYVDLVWGNAVGMAKLITHPVANAAHVSGVIGMERAASQIQDVGWGPYLHLAAAISVALGILNLLPIPALDGGRAIFIIAELLRGRPVDPEKEAYVHAAGFAFLMVLMVFVAYHDIANIFAGKEVL